MSIFKTIAGNIKEIWDSLPEKEKQRRLEIDKQTKLAQEKEELWKLNQLSYRIFFVKHKLGDTSIDPQVRVKRSYPIVLQMQQYYDKDEFIKKLARDMKMRPRTYGILLQKTFRKSK